MIPVATPSRIDAVTVYRRGARITRVAELAPAEGGLPPAVRIGGLALGMDDSSVRARVEPDAPGGGDVPVARDLRVVLDLPELDPDLRPADDAALEAARREVQTLERLVAQIERELGRLEHLALLPRPAGAEGERPPAAPLEARRSLIQLRAERERRLRGELADARDQLDRAERRQAVLEDQDLRASRARQARDHELRKAVLVTLSGQANGRFRLVLEYLVPGASWAPVYAVKLAEDMASAELVVRAQVAQDTGEDWTRVAMTLSTAQAEAWTELPELASLRIGRKQAPPPRLGWRPPPSGVAELYRDWDRAFASRWAPGAPPPPPGAPAVRPAQAFEAEAPEAGDFDDEETAVERAPSPPPPAMAAPARPQKMAGAVVSPAGGAPPPAIELPADAALRRQRMAKPVAAVMARAAARLARPAPELARKARRAEPTSERETTPGFLPGAEAALADEQPGALVAPAELLRYGDLRMPPPSAHPRGVLEPAGRRELYLELLMEQRIHVRVDVLALVEGARQRALAVAERLPPGCEPVWADAFDYAYPAESRVDVPSDGDFHSIPLCQKRATCDSLYVVVPRESTDVFRTARIENPLEAPLLPGPADVYRGADFLLATRLDMAPAKGSFTLGLGVEQGIKVARNTRFREESAGLMGGSLELHHHIAVEVRNNLASPVPIEVRERVPVVEEKDDDVEVKVAQARPKWEAWQQELEAPGEAPLRGGYRWRITVPAGGREELSADYEVRISSKHELAGGNRREV